MLAFFFFSFFPLLCMCMYACVCAWVNLCVSSVKQLILQVLAVPRKLTSLLHMYSFVVV